MQASIFSFYRNFVARFGKLYFDQYLRVFDIFAQKRLARRQKYLDKEAGRLLLESTE